MNLNRACANCNYRWPTWVGVRCPRCGFLRYESRIRASLDLATDAEG